MIKKEIGGVSFYEFEMFRDLSDVLSHAVFTRRTDPFDSKTIRNILAADSPIVSFRDQLHGTQTQIIDTSELKNLSGFDGDVLMTNRPNIPLQIRIADCASIMLFDPIKKVAANIHAGWRGLSGRIIHESTRKICDRYGCRSENILAAISPSLGPCCSRFTNPEKELPRFMHKFISEENTVDFWSAAICHLRECGIKKDHVENPRVCTFCNPEEFFSFRREKSSGRFSTVIMLK